MYRGDYRENSGWIFRFYLMFHFFSCFNRLIEYLASRSLSRFASMPFALRRNYLAGIFPAVSFPKTIRESLTFNEAFSRSNRSIGGGGNLGASSRRLSHVLPVAIFHRA